MSLLPLLPLVLSLAAAEATPAQPVRMASQAFDSRVEIEVRDLPPDRAERAILAAIEEIHRIEQLSRTDGDAAGGVAELNTTAGQGPHPVDPRLRKMLERGWNFCVWSRGAHGPLARKLYQLWGLHQPPLTRRPPAAELYPATASAACNRLRLEPDANTANLAAGSQVELWGFARGYAVDRATDVLRDHGAGNLWVEIGRVRRAQGPGPEGHGWPAPLPVLPGFNEPLDELYLRDQSLVVLIHDDFLFEVGDEAFPAFLDQRTGEPAHGCQGVFVVTLLAADAEPLAAAMLITGYREGQMRLGGLRPLPAVMWLLGDGRGTPLLASYRWSSLKTIVRDKGGR